MYKPTVRAVHRISLETDRYGQITARALIGAESLPPGAAVVLDAGEGWWISADDLEHIRQALSGVGHISITGVHASRQGGHGGFGLVYGLEAIARRLDELLTTPTLPQTG